MHSHNLSVWLYKPGILAPIYGGSTKQKPLDGLSNIGLASLEARMVDCIVNLPVKLFLNTRIPACLWFLSRNKAKSRFRNRLDEILFIDARNMGYLINRRTRELAAEDIDDIAATYHSRRNPDGDYADVNGFCDSASNRTGAGVGLCADARPVCGFGR